MVWPHNGPNLSGQKNITRPKYGCQTLAKPDINDVPELAHVLWSGSGCWNWTAGIGLLSLQQNCQIKWFQWFYKWFEIIYLCSYQLRCQIRKRSWGLFLKPTRNNIFYHLVWRTCLFTTTNPLRSVDFQKWPPEVVLYSAAVTTDGMWKPVLSCLGPRRASPPLQPPHTAVPVSLENEGPSVSDR